MQILLALNRQSLPLSNISYIIWTNWKQPELTWFIFPIILILFNGLNYFIGLFARILCHANTSCFEYRGHRWDTWWPYLGHLGHLRVGASAIFGTPTHIHCTHKMWPECWTLLGTPPLPPPPPPWRLNLREEFGDNPLIDFRGISSCIMDMSYHSWSRPSLCDSGLQSALPEYWYVPLTPCHLHFLSSSSWI